MRSAGQPGERGLVVPSQGRRLRLSTARSQALHLRCRRRGAAGEPVGVRTHTLPQNAPGASATWSCVTQIASPAPGPLVLHLLIKMETATEVWACGQSHWERWAGLVRVQGGNRPMGWARGLSKPEGRHVHMEGVRGVETPQGGVAAFAVGNP